MINDSLPKVAAQVARTGAQARTGASASNGTAPHDGHSNGYPDIITPAITSGVLAPHHRVQLESESAISTKAIEARGYFTQTDKQALKLLGFAPSQCLAGLVIPLYNWRGERAGYALRPDIPRNGSNGKPIKYELPQGEPLVLDIAPLAHDQIDDPAKPLIITEGAKKADSAASRDLCAINLNGVYGFRGRNLQGGITALPDWENIAVNGRAVYIAFDSDVATKPQVESAMQRLAGFLKARGAIVKISYLPEGKNGAKTGLDDFFMRGGTVAEMFSLVRDLASLEETRAQKKQAKSEEVLAHLKADGLPIIETCGRQQADELRDLSEAIKRYNASTPRLFRGTGGLGLVRIEEEAGGQPRMKSAHRDAVKGIAGDVARWISTSEREGVRNVAPPRDLCDVYLAMPEAWRGVPILEGTASAPFFAADGTLCATNGYHLAARIWLSLPDNFQLPDTTPTPENIEAAKTLILSTLLGEVAFVDDASRAHAIAQMILPFVRQLIDGATPLHLWSAPLRGSGKSYAACACIMPFTTPTPTPEKSTPEEWRKSLLCELVTGPSHIFIDNIKGNERGALNSSALDLAITEGSIRDRLTGTGEVVTARIKCVWVATANNAELSEDAVTRTLVIRLDPNSENPDRREFQSDPKTFIRENRAQVCGAILTLVRAWQAKGAPKYSGPHRWRFPQWQAVIGGILEANGIDGFLDNLETEREALNTGGDDWAEFVTLWHETHGEEFVTAQELLPIADKVPGIAASLEKSEGVTRARNLMRFVRHRRDRIYSGLKITGGPVLKRKVSFRLLLKSPNVQSKQSKQSKPYNAQIVTNFHELETNGTPNRENNAPIAPYSSDSAYSAYSAHLPETTSETELEKVEM
jgi:hypothetical protein